MDLGVEDPRAGSAAEAPSEQRSDSDAGLAAEFERPDPELVSDEFPERDDLFVELDVAPPPVAPLDGASTLEAPSPYLDGHVVGSSPIALPLSLPGLGSDASAPAVGGVVAPPNQEVAAPAPAAQVEVAPPSAEITVATPNEPSSSQPQPVAAVEGATSQPDAPVNELRVAVAASPEAPRVEPEIAALPERPTFRPELGRAVLDRIRLVLRPDVRTATIDLHPAELGRVQVKLSMRDGTVAATFRAETVQARDILERQLPELRASLAALGLGTEGIDVEVELGDPDTGATPNDDDSRSSKSSTFDLARLGSPGTDIATHDHAPLASSSGVDTFA